MRYPSKWSARRSVGVALIAAGVAWPEGPASAAIVEASAFGGNAFVSEVIRTSDGAELPRDSVAISTDGINLTVSRTTPGVSAASDTAVVVLENGLDVEVRAVGLFDGSTSWLIDLDSRQRAQASAFVEFRQEGQQFDASSFSVGGTCQDSEPPDVEPQDRFCDTESDVDSFGAGFSVLLAPFDTPGSQVRFDIEGAARAELSIIPLPAPAGLMLLGIGVLGWIGRNRALSGLHL